LISTCFQKLFILPSPVEGHIWPVGGSVRSSKLPSMIDRQTDRLTDRQTDRQTDIDRQTDR